MTHMTGIPRSPALLYFGCLRCIMTCAALLTLLPLWSAPTPAIAWDKYGAIAYSQSDRRWGYSYNWDSRYEAEQRALQECSAKGRACKVVTWFKNNCGALANGSNGAYGYAWGPNKEAAIRKATRYCRQQGGTHCTWRCWACNSR
jgi:serine/threonine-protein kinase